MKHHYIFICCLMFATVMMMGLSIQSCKTKRHLESTVSVDSARYAAYHHESDSLQFTRLLEKFQRNYSIEIKRYRPMMDTAGNVVGSYLAETAHIELQDQTIAERADSMVVRSQMNDTLNVTTSVDTQLIKDTKRDSFPYIYLGIFLFLLICLLIKIRG